MIVLILLAYFTSATTITEADITTTGNLTIGQKVSFSLGGIIDNIISSRIMITGNLNVTSNATISGSSLKVNNQEVCLINGANCLNETVKTLITNFVSGTGTAGVDNTAQDIVTILLLANTMKQNGDRIRIRSYWKGDTGSAVTSTLVLNGVTLATTADSGAATFQVNEAWLHYIDNTHANIISMAGGALDTSISNNNVSGFDFDSDQNVTLSQNGVSNNHAIVFFLAGDIFPR